MATAKNPEAKLKNAHNNLNSFEPQCSLNRNAIIKKNNKNT